MSSLYDVLGVTKDATPDPLSRFKSQYDTAYNQMYSDIFGRGAV